LKIDYIGCILILAVGAHARLAEQLPAFIAQQISKRQLLAALPKTTTGVKLAGCFHAISLIVPMP
jgi:hypothetical protein